jgi:hypothetical protein
MAVLVLVMGAGGADAQNLSTSPGSRSSPQAPTQGMAVDRQAPIGHRQPTLRDLPPDIRRQEQLGDPATGQPGPAPSTDAIDPQLRICRGC